MRNPYGLAVDAATGRAYFTDNRDTVGDAVYELEAGGNYGWAAQLLAREPLVLYDTPKGMAGMAVYRGSALPELDGGVFYCAFHVGGGLFWVDASEGADVSTRNRRVTPGCTSGVVQGADGFLYYLAFFEGALSRIARDPEASP